MHSHPRMGVTAEGQRSAVSAEQSPSDQRLECGFALIVASSEEGETRAFWSWASTVGG